MKDLKGIINNFEKARILVVGDLILDEFIWGDVERISPEAPVPVVWAKKRTFTTGGSANVAYNIRAMGSEVCLVGVVGKDKNAAALAVELKKRKIITDGIFSEAGRHTTVKTRIIAGHQQVVRLDWEHLDSISEISNRRIIAFIKKNIKKFDAVIIEDYGKGVINKLLVEEIVDLARYYRKVITVDPKEEHFQYYRGATSITPNRRELENAVKNLKIKDTSNKFKLNDYRLFTDEDIKSAAVHIMKYLHLNSLLVTLGEQGMWLFEKSGHSVRIPTFAQEVFDVSGAGDTVIAVFTLGLCCGADIKEAARLANYAAGIVVGKIGTAVTNRRELVKAVTGK